MLKTSLGIVGVLIIASVVSAQMTPDEALQKIQERQFAATSQPSDPQTEIIELKAVIAQQAKQIDELKSELAATNLRISRAQGIASSASPAVLRGPIAGSTFESRESTQKMMPVSFNDTSGRMVENPNYTRYMDGAKKIDAAIDAFGAANNIDAKWISAMHAGDPKPGMPEGCLNQFLALQTLSETTNGTIYKATEKMGKSASQNAFWQIIVQNGIVSRVDIGEY